MGLADPFGIVLGLEEMTEAEAREAGVPEKDRQRYVKLVDLKDSEKTSVSDL